MVNNKLQKTIVPLAYAICLFIVIGFCGSYELDMITEVQLLVRILSSVIVSKILVYMLTKINFVITKTIYKF